MKNLIFLCLISLFLFSCGKELNEPQGSYLLFPAGRSVLGQGQIKVSINNLEYKPDNIFDSCGGYWLKIPKSDLPQSGTVSILFTRKKANLEFFPQ